MINTKTLINAELPTTRIADIYKACDQLHSAVAQLDLGNRQLLADKFPEVLAVAQQFGEGCPFSDNLEI